MSSRARTVLRFLVLSVLVALVAAGCGGGDDGGGGGEVDTTKGRSLFKKACASCHTLADAEANGSFGPNLDDLAPDESRTRDQISVGGGGMPENILEGADADTVAAYVAQVAGNGGGGK